MTFTITASGEEAKNCGSPSVFDSIQLLARRLSDGPCLNCDKISQSCDLKKIEPLPRLVFVSEANHQSTDVEQVRLRLIEKALRGGVVLASEVSSDGYYLSQEKQKGEARVLAGDSSISQLYGIESPVPWSLTRDYLIQKSFLEDGDADQKLKPLVLMISENAFVAEAFQKAKSRLPQRLIQKTQSAVEQTSRDFAHKKLKSSSYVSLPFEEAKLLADEVHLSMIELANQKYQSQLLGEPLPVLKTKEDAARIGFKDQEVVPNSLLWKLKVDLRDRDMAGRVIDVLCQYAGKKDLVVVEVGSGHIYGMEKILTHLSGGRLKPEVLDTANEKDRELALKLNSH